MYADFTTNSVNLFSDRSIGCGFNTLLNYHDFFCFAYVRRIQKNKHFQSSWSFYCSKVFYELSFRVCVQDVPNRIALSKWTIRSRRNRLRRKRTPRHRNGTRISYCKYTPYPHSLFIYSNRGTLCCTFTCIVLLFFGYF